MRKGYNNFKAPSAKRHRGGYYLLLYGPKGAPTHARLAPSTSIAPDKNTPEAFYLELVEEARRNLHAERWFRDNPRIPRDD